MKYAFSRAGLDELETLRGHEALYAFDFDGTLAPIVPDPREAGTATRTRRLLERLAAHAAVAAVSGRRVRELRSLVPSSFTALAGDHGAEILPCRLQRFRGLSRARAVVRSWDRQLARLLPPEDGVWIERKDLSLAVHFRHSPRPKKARDRILRAVAAVTPGPRILPGKCVVNLLIPGLPHKGDAVRALMQGLGLHRALYVGDDANDEDVFALSDPSILTVRVGRLAGSRASLYLRGQSEIDRLLRLLLSLQGRRAPRYRGRREENPEEQFQKTVDRHRPRRHENRGGDRGRERPASRRKARAHPARRLAGAP